jgi:hypothetical protein
MIIAITGSNGYIGQTLCQKILNSGHEVFPVQRTLLYENTNKLAELLSKVDAVINLAGSPILRRWTIQNKQDIYNSRVLVTQNVVRAINNLPAEKRPKIFISASAVGIYSPGKTHDENSDDWGRNFLASVVKDWESASAQLVAGVRRVIFRMGVVLGKDSQIYRHMRLPFMNSLGGRIGNGQQPFPFVHIDDVVNAFVLSLTDDQCSGTYNLTAPVPATNKQFTKALGKALKRPAVMVIPIFVLKLIFGEAATVISTGPIAIPRRLSTQNFQFQYPTIEEVIREITS